MTSVTVIIVSFNTREYLHRCIGEVVELPNVETIVIDNASADGSADAVAEAFSTVQLIRNPENVGFATAVNQGLECGKGPYFLLLNSDTFEVQDAIPRLVRFLDEHPDVGIVAPQLRNLDGSLQPSGRSMLNRWEEFFWTLSLYRLAGKKGSDRFFDPSLDYELTRDVEEVSGACLMTRREVLDAVGILDAHYFFCFEDLDFCSRTRQAGFRVVYFPEAKLIHAWGASAKEAGPSLTRHFLAGYFYYLRRSQGRLFEVLMRILVGLKTVLTLPVVLFRGRQGVVVAANTMLACFGKRS